MDTVSHYPNRRETAAEGRVTAIQSIEYLDPIKEVLSAIFPGLAAWSSLDLVNAQKLSRRNKGSPRWAATERRLPERKSRCDGEYYAPGIPYSDPRWPIAVAAPVSGCFGELILEQPHSGRYGVAGVYWICTVLAG